MLSGHLPCLDVWASHVHLDYIDKSEEGMLLVRYLRALALLFLPRSLLLYWECLEKRLVMST